MKSTEQQRWIEHYRAEGVSLEEADFGYGPVYILADSFPSRYVLKFSQDLGLGPIRLVIELSSAPLTGDLSAPLRPGWPALALC